MCIIVYIILYWIIIMIIILYISIYIYIYYIIMAIEPSWDRTPHALCLNESIVAVVK